MGEESMNKNLVFYIVLSVCIVVSFGFTCFYFMKALNYTVTVTAEQAKLSHDYHFVLIGQEFDNPYHKKVLEGAQTAAKEHDVLLEFIGPKQTNIDEHTKLIEMAIAARVDGILTQGLTNREFKPVIDKAISKGIPVITIDTDLEDSRRVAYVGTNNYEAGKQMGEALAEATNGEAKVAIVTGILYANNLMERVQGFLDVIENYPDIEVVAMESSNISQIQAAEKTYQMLRNHPEVTAFFGTSALDGIGIAQAVTKANLQEDILIFAFDDLEETMELMEQEKIFATLKQEPYEMGYQGVSLLVETMKGQPIPKINYTSLEVIYKEESR